MTNEKFTNCMIIAGFITSGLHDACSPLPHLNGFDNFSVLLEKWDKGCFELIDAAVAYAPVIEQERLNCFILGDFEVAGGMFDYEVSEEFGQWFGEHVLVDGNEPSQFDAHTKIKALVNEWAHGTLPKQELPAQKRMTEQEIVDGCERMARSLASSDGFIFDDRSFRLSASPRAQMYWRQAVDALAAYNGTDAENAVQELGLES